MSLISSSKTVKNRLTVNGSHGGTISSRTLFVDLHDGFVSNAGALSHHMKNRGHVHRALLPPKLAPFIKNKHLNPQFLRCLQLLYV